MKSPFPPAAIHGRHPFQVARTSRRRPVTPLQRFRQKFIFMGLCQFSSFRGLRAPRSIFRSAFTMTMDKSLRVRAGMTRARSVLTRDERIKRLKDAERWKDGDSPYGLPKGPRLQAGDEEKEEEGRRGAKEGARCRCSCRQGSRRRQSGRGWQGSRRRKRQPQAEKAPAAGGKAAAGKAPAAAAKAPSRQGPRSQGQEVGFAGWACRSILAVHTHDGRQSSHGGCSPFAAKALIFTNRETYPPPDRFSYNEQL